MSKRPSATNLKTELEEMQARGVKAAPVLLKDLELLAGAARHYLSEVDIVRRGQVDEEEIAQVFGDFSEGEGESKGESDARKDFQKYVTKLVKDLKDAVRAERIDSNDALRVAVMIYGAFSVLDDKGLVLSEYLPHGDKGDEWMEQAIRQHGVRTEKNRTIAPDEARDYFSVRGTLWPNARGAFANLNALIGELSNRGRGL